MTFFFRDWIFLSSSMKKSHSVNLSVMTFNSSFSINRVVVVFSSGLLLSYLFILLRFLMKSYTFRSSRMNPVMHVGSCLFFDSDDILFYVDNLSCIIFHDFALLIVVLELRHDYENIHANEMHTLTNLLTSYFTVKYTIRPYWTRWLVIWLSRYVSTPLWRSLLKICIQYMKKEYKKYDVRI